MIPTKTIINNLREYAKISDWHLRRIMLEAAKRLELVTIEVEFTRQFVHDHGLEYALASAWERRCEDG